MEIWRSKKWIELSEKKPPLMVFLSILLNKLPWLEYLFPFIKVNECLNCVNNFFWHRTSCVWHQIWKIGYQHLLRPPHPHQLGIAHHMFSQFLNLQILFTIFVLFFYKAQVFYWDQARHSFRKNANNIVRVPEKAMKICTGFTYCGARLGI